MNTIYKKITRLQMPDMAVVPASHSEEEAIYFCRAAVACIVLRGTQRSKLVKIVEDDLRNAMAASKNYYSYCKSDLAKSAYRTACQVLENFSLVSEETLGYFTDTDFKDVGKLVERQHWQGYYDIFKMNTTKRKSKSIVNVYLPITIGHGEDLVVEFDNDSSVTLTANQLTTENDLPQEGYLLYILERGTYAGKSIDGLITAIEMMSPIFESGSIHRLCSIIRGLGRGDVVSYHSISGVYVSDTIGRAKFELYNILRAQRKLGLPIGDADWLVEFINHHYIERDLGTDLRRILIDNDCCVENISMEHYGSMKDELDIIMGATIYDPDSDRIFKLRMKAGDPEGDDDDSSSGKDDNSDENDVPKEGDEATEEPEGDTNSTENGDGPGEGDTTSGKDENTNSDDTSDSTQTSNVVMINDLELRLAKEKPSLATLSKRRRYRGIVDGLLAKYNGLTASQVRLLTSLRNYWINLLDLESVEKVISRVTTQGN